MTQTVILIICVLMSMFIYFYSPREENVLGYKSLQLGTNKNAWKWSNRCFGIISIIGSLIFLSVDIIGRIRNDNYNLYKYILLYIVLAFIITEVYVIIKKLKDK